MGKTAAAMIAMGVLASLGQPLSTWEDTGCVGARHVQINDVSGYEGNVPARQPTVFQFEVTSTGCADNVVVRYDVGAIDGTSSSDLKERFGYLWLPLGDKDTRFVSVTVNADNVAEHDELFAVWLSGSDDPSLVIDDCVGGGTIVNDDLGVVLEPKIGSRLHCSE